MGETVLFAQSYGAVIQFPASLGVWLVERQHGSSLVGSHVHLYKFDTMQYSKWYMHMMIYIIWYITNIIIYVINISFGKVTKKNKVRCCPIKAQVNLFVQDIYVAIHVV